MSIGAAAGINATSTPQITVPRVDRERPPLSTEPTWPQPDGDTMLIAMNRPQEAAIPANAVQWGTQQPESTVASKVLKAAARVPLAVQGAVLGTTAGVAFGIVGPPIGGAYGFAKDETGLKAAGKALGGFVIGVAVIPFAILPGAISGGYVGALTGADLVDKALDPKGIDMKERVKQHLAELKDARSFDGLVSGAIKDLVGIKKTPISISLSQLPGSFDITRK